MSYQELSYTMWECHKKRQIIIISVKVKKKKKKRVHIPVLLLIGYGRSNKIIAQLVHEFSELNTART